MLQFNFKMPKGRYVFNDNLKEKYPFIQETISRSDVICRTCTSEFSIVRGGKCLIDRHIKTKKHKAAADAKKYIENYPPIIHHLRQVNKTDNEHMNLSENFTTAAGAAGNDTTFKK